MKVGVFPVPEQPPTQDPLASFGANEWLVDELYQQYLQDKDAVDPAWWEFFADYHPTDGGRIRATSNSSSGSGTGGSGGDIGGGSGATATGPAAPDR